MDDKISLSTQVLKEVAYAKNLGFEELMNFHKVATPKQSKEMDDIIQKEDTKRYKRLIRKVLGVELR